MAETIYSIDIDALVAQVTSGVGPDALNTSMEIQFGIWAELRAIRMSLEIIANRDVRS